MGKKRVREKEEKKLQAKRARLPERQPEKKYSN